MTVSGFRLAYTEHNLSPGSGETVWLHPARFLNNVHFCLRGRRGRQVRGDVDNWLLGRKSRVPSIVVWPGRGPSVGRGGGSHGQSVPVMWGPPGSEGLGGS